MRLHLFRHGETDWNLVHRCQGQLMDPPVSLNAEGIEQAKNTGEILVDMNLDIIFSSDLHRAKETAEVVADINGLNIIYDERLLETNFGDIQGFLPDEQKDIDGYEGDVYFIDYDHRFPNGECVNDVKKRAFECLKEIALSYDYYNVGIATHGGVIGNIRSDVSGEPYVPTKNGEVFSIEYDKEKDKFITVL